MSVRRHRGERVASTRRASPAPCHERVKRCARQRKPNQRPRAHIANGTWGGRAFPKKPLESPRYGDVSQTNDYPAKLVKCPAAVILTPETVPYDPPSELPGQGVTYGTQSFAPNGADPDCCSHEFPALWPNCCCPGRHRRKQRRRRSVPGWRLSRSRVGGSCPDRDCLREAGRWRLPAPLSRAAHRGRRGVPHENGLGAGRELAWLPARLVDAGEGGVVAATGPLPRA